jgi:hypothetical protein
MKKVLGFSAGTFVLVLAVVWLLKTTEHNSDTSTRPPKQAIVYSENKKCSFTITITASVEGRSQGSVVCDGLKLWEHELPNPVRPRLAAINNNGEVITLDDWDNNRKSEYAIVTFTREGYEWGEYSIEAVENRFWNTEEQKFSPGPFDHTKAKLGLWLAEPPRVIAEGLFEIPTVSGSVYAQPSSGGLLADKNFN